MVGPKKQDFWLKINILKGNLCILRVRGAPVRQKLGMILENKVVQKLMFFYKNDFLFEKIPFIEFESMILALFDKP